jgi:hypothetical protein
MVKKNSRKSVKTKLTETADLLKKKITPNKKKQLDQKVVAKKRPVPAKKIATHLKNKMNPEETHHHFHDETTDFVPNLPPGYGDNLICLMIRDPEWIYTYWEIQESRKKWGLEQLEASMEEIDYSLRVYDLSESEAYEVYFDIKIEAYVGSWFIKVSPNHRYCIEIGLKRHRDGRFVALVKSNISQTPPDEISDVIDENWMGLDMMKMYALSGGLSVGANSAEIQQFFKEKLVNQLSSSSGIGSFSTPTSFSGRGG